MKNRRKQLWLNIVIAFLLGGALVSCSDSSDSPSDNEEKEQPAISARITETIRYESEKTTVYNFEYTSTDPFGQPCTLSGVICVGDEVSADKHARGMLLYNHFTVYRADQCPTKGDLTVQKLMTGSGLITVSADYYGFGVTADKQQAYCISAANAQASIDALLAARQLLKEKGFTWDDILFNAGYSQGGQTAMGIVRLVTEKYPDIHLTYTFAGAGSYDIPETYRQFIQQGQTGMPSTVISVLLAYNEYFKMGIPREDIFIDPTLSHLDEWLLSKQNSREKIDRLIGTNAISDFMTPAMLNLDSELSKRFMEVLEKDNLSKGWTPRKGEKIILVHNTADETVPVANTERMYEFFTAQGLRVSTKNSSSGDIYVDMGNWGSLPTMPAHELGAVFFLNETVGKVCEVLGIRLWLTLNLNRLAEAWGG